MCRHSCLHSVRMLWWDTVSIWTSLFMEQFRMFSCCSQSLSGVCSRKILRFTGHHCSCAVLFDREISVPWQCCWYSSSNNFFNSVCSLWVSKFPMEFRGIPFPSKMFRHCTCTISYDYFNFGLRQIIFFCSCWRCFVAAACFNVDTF